MLVVLDYRSEIPLGKQIANQVRRAIAAGELRPGERLPSARRLGESVDVNMHTVLGAYAALRDQGVIEMRQGRGARVCPDVRPVPETVILLAKELLESAAEFGLSRTDVAILLERV
ncbi:GntR family transcriptional regulator [Frondihabitans sp. PAMC 28766]|uniref:GntR family transcriptional regulator n=1 Tax=Frondihabitans sp. PAMC 28766 TaxID=1795630 RepID=UPI0009E770A7|nr:GntR family transcriptional regulator [Frondihabitans sp. PAMC 28766]